MAAGPRRFRLRTAKNTPQANSEPALTAMAATGRASPVLGEGVIGRLGIIRLALLSVSGTVVPGCPASSTGPDMAIRLTAATCPS